MSGLDLGQAVVLGLVLVGLTQLVMTLVKGPNDARIVAVVALGVALVAVQLVAASDFAAEQIVLDRPLNSMNFASQLVVSLLAAGIASGVWQGYVALKNVGQNHDA
jgi:hypothetical protein